MALGWMKLLYDANYRATIPKCLFPRILTVVKIPASSECEEHATESLSDAFLLRYISNSIRMPGTFTRKRNAYSMQPPNMAPSIRRKLIAVATISMLVAATVVVSSSYIFVVGLLSPQSNSSQCNETQPHSRLPPDSNTSRQSRALLPHDPTSITPNFLTSTETETTTASGVQITSTSAPSISSDAKASILSSTLPPPRNPQTIADQSESSPLQADHHSNALSLAASPPQASSGTEQASINTTESVSTSRPPTPENNVTSSPDPTSSPGPSNQTSEIASKSPTSRETPEGTADVFNGPTQPTRPNLPLTVNSTATSEFHPSSTTPLPPLSKNSTLFASWSEKWQTFRKKWANSKVFVLTNSGVVLTAAFLQFISAASISICVKRSMPEGKVQRLASRWIVFNAILFIILTFGLVTFAAMGSDPEKQSENHLVLPPETQGSPKGFFSKSLIANIYIFIILADVIGLFFLILTSSCLLRHINPPPHHEFDVCQ